MLHAPQHDEQEGRAREEGEQHHRRHAEDIGDARQRRLRGAQLGAQHQGGQQHDDGDAAIVQRTGECLCAGRTEQRIDPALLEGDRSGQRFGHDDESAAHDEREPPVQPSGARVGASSCSRAIETEQPEMLRGEVVTHEKVIHDGDPDHALVQRHRQHALGSQEQDEAGDDDGQRRQDEARSLRREQGAVGGRRVSEPRRRNAVAEPQGHRQGEEEPVNRAGANVVVSPPQPQDQGGQPQRIQDPDEVPGRAPDPGPRSRKGRGDRLRTTLGLECIRHRSHASAFGRERASIASIATRHHRAYTGTFLSASGIPSTPIPGRQRVFGGPPFVRRLVRRVRGLI